MIELTDDMMKKVESIAMATDRSPDWVVKHALDIYMIEEGERILAAIEARTNQDDVALSVEEMRAVIDGDDLLPLVKRRMVTLVQRHRGKLVVDWLTHRSQLMSGGTLVGMIDVPAENAHAAWDEADRICVAFGLMNAISMALETTPEGVARAYEKGEVWE